MTRPDQTVYFVTHSPTCCSTRRPRVMPLTHVTSTAYRADRRPNPALVHRPILSRTKCGTDFGQLLQSESTARSAVYHRRGPAFLVACVAATTRYFRARA